MQRFWFVSNAGSGSTSPAGTTAIVAALAAAGIESGGHSRFPEEPLPDPEALRRDGIDTVVLYAGDGTINAAIERLADWDGAILILPGGTMNLLSGILHPAADPVAIVRAAIAAPDTRALPFVAAGGRRAYCGLIVGPAASWARAREAVRKGQVRAMLRAIGHAWGRTFGRGIRVSGIALPRAQAIFIRPHEAYLDVAAIDARNWRAIAQLGWGWVTGDWVSANAVSQVRAERLRIAERHPTIALFDGEPERLDPGTEIVGGMSRQIFVTTQTQT